MVLRFLTLALLVLLPLSWFAPLLRAGFLPLLGLSDISVVTGLQALWGADPALALLVSFLALFAPVAKLCAVALVQWGIAAPRLLRLARVLGRLAMADVFLIALYVVVAKGVGVGRVETAWGLWLFTACVLGSIAVAWIEERRHRSD